MKIILFLLLLLVNSIESRREPGGHWRNVMRDEPLPEATKEKEDCLEDMKFENEKPFVKGREPRPTISFYLQDVEKKSSFKDTEPQSGVTFYPNDNFKVKHFAKDIEPRPTVSIYPNDVKAKLFAKDIEPRPNVSSYPDDIKDELFTKDIEPRPSTTFYPRDLNVKVSSTNHRHDKSDHIQMITQS